MLRSALMTLFFSASAYAGCPDFSGTYVYEQATCYKITYTQSGCASLNWEFSDGQTVSTGTAFTDGVFRQDISDPSTGLATHMRETDALDHVVIIEQGTLFSANSIMILDSSGNIESNATVYDAKGEIVGVGATSRWLRVHPAKSKACAVKSTAKPKHVPFVR